MNYQEARRVRNTGLFNLAAQNIASGGGIGSSLGSAISSKFKAKITGIKEKFDPLNIAKKLTGNFGAAVLGKLTGRSRKDIQYFAGGRGYGSSSGVTQESNLDAIQPALYTNVKEGQRQRMKKGDSVSDVLARLYNLTKKNYEAEENRRDKEIRDKYKENERNQKWHKELLDAILGPNRLKKEKNKKTTKKGSNIFDFINNLQNKFNSFIEGLENKIKEGAEKAIEKKVAKSALKTAAETAAETAGKEVGKDVTKATAEEVGKDVTKATAEEVGKDVTKATAEEVGKDVTKAATTTAAETTTNVATRTATETVAETAGKTVAATTAESASKTAVKEVSESAIKETAKKSVGKLVAKAGSESIPLVGGLIGAAFAVPRMIKGDFFGAGLEVASGVGGVGTSVAGGVLLAARDVYNEVYKNPETGVPASLENDLVTDYDGTKERLTKITNVIDTLITESLKQRKEDTAKAAEMNKPVVTENEGGAAFIHRGSGLKRGTGQATKVSPTESTPTETATKASMVTNNQSSSNMVNNTTTNMSSATMAPPTPNPLTERVVSSINENNNLQIEKSQPKIVTIDKSKNINVASKDNSPSLVLDSSVNVRSDDPTLQRTQRQNLRPV